MNANGNGEAAKGPSQSSSQAANKFQQNPKKPMSKVGLNQNTGNPRSIKDPNFEAIEAPFSKRR